MTTTAFASQIISPTGNDFLRLNLDRPADSRHYFPVLESTDRILDYTEAQLGSKTTSQTLGLDIPPEKLDQRLKKTLGKINIFEQEKGLESCFLTFGLLSWKHQDSEGRAPILRVPCTLVNRSGTWFVTQIEYSEMEPNPMLSYLLEGIGQAPLIDVIDEGDPILEIDKTFKALQDKIHQAKADWEIEANAALFGCFVYSGIPLAEVNPLQFTPPSEQFWFEQASHSNTQDQISDQVTLDLPATITPADSSQLQVLIASRKRRNLVIQGPPGTGKSQTIVNLIADAVQQGKKILFIAQKETALNVVFSRLPDCLSPLCLKLYQSKELTDRRNLFTQIAKRLQYNPSDSSQQTNRIDRLEEKLDSYGEFLNFGRDSNQITNYTLLTRLIPLTNIPVYELSNPNQDQVNLQAIFSLLADIEKMSQQISTPHWMWWSHLQPSQIRTAKTAFESILPFIQTTPAVFSDIQQWKQASRQIESVGLTKEQTIQLSNLGKIRKVFNQLWRKTLKNNPQFKPEEHLENFSFVEQCGFRPEDVEQLMKVIQVLDEYHLPKYPSTTTLQPFLTYLLENWQDSSRASQIAQKLVQVHELCPNTSELCRQLLEKGEFHSKIVEKSILEAILHQRDIPVTPGQMKQTMSSYQKELRDQFSSYFIPVKAVSPEEIQASNSRRVSEKTGFALLSHVAAQTKARVSVRHLMDQAFPQLQEIFPCWLTTPSKLAMTPRHLNLFDLVLIDEASQMLRAEALGALGRSRQFVIFGDSQQMPPSNLMREDLEMGDRMEDRRESILDWGAANLPNLLLQYHYRSEHHSLIAFSNHHFYNENLYCVPSQKLGDDYGIKHVYVSDAVYNPKTADPNIREAEKTVEEAIESIRKHPSRSLGIVTLNIRQQETIERLFDHTRVLHSDIQDYCKRQQASGTPVFIKNLETVQGDERDCMIVSTVFGKDAVTGQVYQRFGLNREGDEKRINVLITRAKKQNIIVTSLKPEEITSSQKGPQILRAYLSYARDTQITSPLSPTNFTQLTSEKTFDSPWEQWFYEKLTADGYQVDTQVGVGKWRIDLAIRSQRGYLCGIELDGAAYHSSLVARERDALRQDVLERHGWTIFRVWSTDYFLNPEGEYAELLRQIAEHKSK